MRFSSAEDFELHVHKCFGHIFEILVKVDQVVKEGAEQEEVNGQHGTMSDLRDWVEDIMLHCHLAWQYHRLSKGSLSKDTWDRISEKEAEESASQLTKD